MRERSRTALVLGGETGLLGQSLAFVLEKEGWTVLTPPRGDVDIFDTDAVAEFLDREQVGHLFNAVAYTRVDDAEDNKEEAFRVNQLLPATLGRAVRKTGTRLVHYSTDFVFSGRKDLPYTPEDEPHPVSVYGSSKAAGEKSLLELDLPGLIIIRTAWLFGPGRMNFVDRILELGRERDTLRVVHDQVGSPTYSRDVALHSLHLVQADGRGIFHIANSGKASWCELASEAVSCMGLACRVEAVTSDQYPTKATRPAYSVLDTAKYSELTGRTPRSWIKALRTYLFQKDAREIPEE
ncbi:MAG: dTDP-4-dehydrorhamnose reductase [Desulfovibrionales bacterium]